MYKVAKIISIFIPLVVLHFSVPDPAVAQREKMDLDFKKRTLSANIRGATLSAVIEEIKKEKAVWFKLWFKEKDSLLREKISLRFDNLPIRRGLKRIFSNTNHSFVFDDQGNLVGVILLGKPERTPAGSSSRYRAPRRIRRR